LLTIKSKLFKELSLEELYNILQLRSDVFVVEQNCIYQDIDNKDKKAIHILGYKKDNLVAYTRVFKSGDYFKDASIGRVLVKSTQRKQKYGYSIMKASIDFIKDELNETIIKISAQQYLKQFYINLGFHQVGNSYLEDGIPHVTMIKK